MDASQQDILRQLNTCFSQPSIRNSKHFILDGHQFTISSAKTSLLKLMTQAIDHLTSPKLAHSELLLTLLVGESALINSFFTWIRQEYGDKIIRVNCSEYSLYYNPGLNDSFASLSFFNRQTGYAIYWIQAEDKIPWYEKAAPFRMILRWYFALCGYTLLHGATVSLNGYGALIVGSGGKGKTTTALTSFNTKHLQYLSDDYTLVKIDEKVWAYSLYSSAKERPKNSEATKESAKITTYYANSRKLAKQTQLIAILVPEIGHAQVSFTPISQAKTLIAIAPSTLIQLFPEDDDQSAFKLMSKLVQALPSYKLKLSAELGEIGFALEKFLAPKFVSVILPVYNTEEFIKESLDSVKVALKNYSYEIIVVDDGSNDGTRSILESDPSLTILTQQRGGPSSARNRGLSVARGEYIGFIDADDVWTSDHFTYLLNLLKRKNSAMVALGYSQRYFGINPRIPLNKQEEYGVPVLMPSFGCGIFKNTLFSSIGLLNENYGWHEDVDWYLRLCEQKIPLIISKHVVKFYRLHTHNTTKDWVPTDKKILGVIAKSLKRRNGEHIPSLKDYEI